MSHLTHTCPQTREQVINMYFLEHRAKLLDVAAFLDRIDRAHPTPGANDFREVALKQAIALLIDGEPHRAKRVLELLSDSTTETPQSAYGMKGASGPCDKPVTRLSRVEHFCIRQCFTDYTTQERRVTEEMARSLFDLADNQQNVLDTIYVT